MRKVHVVGIDACVMTMIEVAYQLRDHAKILVRSEEVEPGPVASRGDPRRPHEKSDDDTGGLGATVVHCHVESHRHGGETATQSAVDVGQLDDMVEAVDVRARRLLGITPV